MKYTWITHEPFISGANKFMLEIILELLKLNHNVHVITTRKNELTDYLENINISYSVVPYYSWTGSLYIQGIKQIFRNVISLPTIIKIIKKQKTNIVVSNTVTIGIGALSSKIANKKHYWFIHEYGKEDHGIKFKFGEFLSFKIVDLLSQKVIVVSKALKNKYLKFIKESKINVFYNFPKVDEEIKKEKINDDFNLIIVGQIVPGKRQEDAILSLKYLKDSFNNVHLTILGKIVNKEYYLFLQELIKNNKLEKYVTFIEFQNNPFQLMKNSDIVLICSKSEAFGRVTIEAMKLGIPVIASNSGANPEIITDNKTGLLYKSGKAEDLSEKIKILLTSPVKANFISNNAYEYSNKYFSDDEFVKQIKNIFV